MAKKPEKQLSPEIKELITKLIDEFDIKSAKDIEDMFKEMFSPMLQEMLESSMIIWATRNTIIAEKADSTAAMATAARQLRPHLETWTSTSHATVTAHSSHRS